MKKVSAFFLNFCMVFCALVFAYSTLSTASADTTSSGLSANSGAINSGTSGRSARATNELPVSQKPKALDEVGIKENLGAQVSIETLKFKNEAGELVPLSTYFHSGKPVIVSFAYYSCPGLCGIVLNALLDSMKGLDWTLGSQYEAVNISIDSKEGPELANEKKRTYLKSLGKPEGEKGWHFLTGSEENIQQVTREMGFGFRWVPEENQFAHAAAVYVLTPEGKVSRILYGIQYRPSDLKLSLLEASSGKIGTIIDRLILFCYQYDPQLKKYSLGVTRVVQVGALATTLFLSVYLGLLWFREKRLAVK